MISEEESKTAVFIWCFLLCLPTALWSRQFSIIACGLTWEDSSLDLIIHQATGGEGCVICPDFSMDSYKEQRKNLKQNKQDKKKMVGWTGFNINGQWLQVMVSWITDSPVPIQSRQTCLLKRQNSSKTGFCHLCAYSRNTPVPPCVIYSEHVLYIHSCVY